MAGSSFDPGVEAPMGILGQKSSSRATRAVVDLDALSGNVRSILRSLSPKTGLMAVVKANGYGHGAVMVARGAVDAGATNLAVATVGEGVRLRAAGLSEPILVLSPIDPSEVERAVHHRLSLTVADPDVVDAVETTRARLRRAAPVSLHVKVDTGMRRNGAPPEEAVSLAERVAGSPRLRLDGFFTHFASADESDERFTLDQAAVFDRCVGRLTARGIPVPRLHAANSAAALRSRRYDYDLVRVGIALYGLPPSPAVPLLPSMRPVLTLRSRVARVIDLVSGDTVSYGRTYRAAENETAALVPIGYADGYPRALSGRGYMGLGGVRAPVRGRVCMDQTVIGVVPGGRVAVGDEVAVVGDGRDAAPTLTEIARLAGTINYEIATGIAARVPRLYVRAGTVVAVEDDTGPHAAALHE